MSHKARRVLCARLVTITAVALLGLAVAGVAPGQRSRTLAPSADPGAYSGLGGGRALAFFVAPGGKKVVNVSMPQTALSCTPGGGGVADYTFAIQGATVRPTGVFSAEGSQTGVFSGYSVQYSYSFSGRFSKATKQHTGTAAGILREDMRYTDSAGVHHTCTTNNQSWTASRSGPKPGPLSKPGKYAGYGAGRALSFTVTPGKLNTIAIPQTALTCAPGGGGAADASFAIPQTPIRADSSFSVKTSQTGVFAGATATFTYAFAGSLQGLNAQGAGSAAGTLREDVTYTDTAGVHRTCTTNTVPWTAARSA
jgi:hypothetical protein